MPRYLINAMQTWEIEARSEDAAYENYELGKLRDCDVFIVDVLDERS